MTRDVGPKNIASPLFLQLAMLQTFSPNLNRISLFINVLGARKVHNKMSGPRVMHPRKTQLSTALFQGRYKADHLQEGAPHPKQADVGLQQTVLFRLSVPLCIEYAAFTPLSQDRIFDQRPDYLDLVFVVQ